MKRIAYYITAIIFIVFAVNAESLQLLGVVNLLSLLVLGYISTKIQQATITPFNITISTLYLFHTSHLWIALLHGDNFILSHRYSTGYAEDLYVFKVLTVLLILFFLIGFIFLKTRERIFADKEDVYRLTSFGKTSIIILYVISFYYEILRANSVSQLGYGEGFQYGSQIGLYVSNLVQTLLLLALYINRRDKREYWLYIGLILFRSLFVIVFVGNRGISVIQLLILLFITSQYASSIFSRKQIRQFVLVSTVGFLILLPFVSMTRGDRNNLSMSEFISSNNPVESFFEEFGGTVTTVFLSDQFVSERGSFNGVQMLATTLTIFPASTFLFGSSYIQYVSFAGMLNDYNNMQGLGGSMLAQLVLNFGYTPLLYLSMIIMALLTVWLSNRLMRGAELTVYQFILLTSFFFGLLVNVRGEWYETVSHVKVALYIMLALFFIQSKGIKFFYRVK